MDKRYVSVRRLSGPDGLEPLRRLGVAFIVLKRYNGQIRTRCRSLPLSLGKAGWWLRSRRIRPGATEAEQARIAPFLHNTDTRIDAALERPGPPLEVWELNGR